MGDFFSRALASHVQDISNFLLIGSLAVGVICTALVVWTGNVKESYLKQDVASANAVAEKAKADAANANRKTAELNARAQEIERDNINLKSNLEKSIIEANLEKQKLAKMQVEVADARKQQAEAERKLEIIRLKQLPRTLNPQQEEWLFNHLKSNPKGLIAFGWQMDAETSEFANQLARIFGKAGWGHPAKNPELNSPTRGILLVVAYKANDLDSLLPPAKSVAIGLVNLGLDVTLQYDLTLPQDVMFLGVGPKP